jgi:uncharacterized protein (DUF433 family)
MNVRCRARAFPPTLKSPGADRPHEGLLLGVTMDTTMDWSGCLQVEQVPGKVSGAPILKDTRMPADAVVENYEAGLPPAVIACYFSLDLQQVEAVIRYYLAHRPDIDPPHSREPVPPLVAALARKIWESAHQVVPGDTVLVDAEGSPSAEGACWWIATHTGGDPIIEDQTSGTSGQGLREFFDAYQTDGRSRHRNH